MRLFIPLLLFCLIGAFACNPCDSYQDETYPEESFVQYLDSTGKKRIQSCLEKYQEPQLDTMDHESYRLIVGYVFSDTIHIVRVEHRGSNYRLMHKRILEKEDSASALLPVLERNLSAQEWKIFHTAIRQHGFWMLPREINRYGLDGATWYIEGRRPAAAICDKRSYHIVSRWAPEDGPFQELCGLMLDMAGIEKL